MNTIEKEWMQYEALVIPKDAGSIQRQETRRAFYAGAQALLEMTNSLGEETVSEDAAVAILQGWHEECQLFTMEIVKGNA